MEEFKNKLANFNSIENETIGIAYLSLESLIGKSDYYLEQMLILADSLKETLHVSQIGFLLNAIIGTDGSQSHGGLVEKAFRLNRPDLAQKYITCAKSFLNKADEHHQFLPFTRRYFIDVLRYFKIKESPAFLYQLLEKDNADNFRCFKEGAEEGNISDMAELAKYFRKGRGCRKNRKLAHFWFSKAIAGGSSTAKKELRNLRYPLCGMIISIFTICKSFVKKYL